MLGAPIFFLNLLVSQAEGLFFLIEFLIIIIPIIKKIPKKIILGPLDVQDIENAIPFIKGMIPKIKNKSPTQKLFSNFMVKLVSA